MSTIAILTLLSVCAWAGWLWRKKRTSALQPPTLPGELPIIGHLHKIIGDATSLWDSVKMISHHTLEQGGPVRVKLGAYDFYFESDPDDCATVFSTCYNKGFFYEFGKPLFGESLVLSKESIWREDRRLIHPAFGQQKINNFNDIFNLNAIKLSEQLSSEVGKSSLKVWQCILDNLLKVVSGTTLGLKSDDVTEQYARNIDKSFKLVVEKFQKPWLWVPFIYNRSENKKLLEEYQTNIMSVIQKRKRELTGPEAKDAEMKTFLDIMIKKGSFTDSQLREHCDLMISASYDTIYHALVLTLILIGSHHKVQEQIYKELQDIFGNSDIHINQNELSKLVYLEAVIKESLRIYPPASVLAREVDKDVQLKNYVIPKGGTFMMCIYGMHRHAVWGPDAEAFRPERWLEPGGVPDNRNAYGPFSLGKRNCIGKQYAMNLMKIYLAHILRKYHVTGNIDDVVLQYQIFITPNSGHELILNKRET